MTGPLAGLTQLTTLRLNSNQIADISALAGLTQLTKVYLWGNPLDEDSCPILQALIDRGVNVSHAVTCF